MHINASQPSLTLDNEHVDDDDDDDEKKVFCICYLYLTNNKFNI